MKNLLNEKKFPNINLFFFLNKNKNIYFFFFFFLVYYLLQLPNLYIFDYQSSKNYRHICKYY